MHRTPRNNESLHRDDKSSIKGDVWKECRCVSCGIFPPKPTRSAIPSPMDGFSLHGAQGPVAGDSKTAEMTGGLEDYKAPSPCSIRTADLDDGKLQTKERGLQGWDESSSTATISSSVSESGWSEEHLTPTPSAMRRHSMRRMRALRRMSREAHVQPYPRMGKQFHQLFALSRSFSSLSTSV